MSREDDKHARRQELNKKPHKAEVLGSRGPSKVTPEVLELFLDHIRKTGRKYESAKIAGVSYATLSTYMNKNMWNLADRVAEAMEDYREAIEQEIHRRAIEGVPEPIIGGKDRDEIITYVQRYSDRLLEFHAKRHIPEYRASTQVDLNVRGGVIAVPAQPTTIEAWAETATKALLPSIEKEMDGSRASEDDNEPPSP